MSEVKLRFNEPIQWVNDYDVRPERIDELLKDYRNPDGWWVKAESSHQVGVLVSPPSLQIDLPEAIRPGIGKVGALKGPILGLCLGCFPV